MATFRPDAFAYLTGKLSQCAVPQAVTRPGDGGKFAPNGNVLPFPGNTFIFHIDQTSDAFAALVEMQDRLKAGPSAGAYSFLPPSSFHMTVFNGVSGTPPKLWPEDTARDVPLADVTTEIWTKTRTLVAPAGLEVTSRDLFGGHSLTMEGADQSHESALRLLREQLREATNLWPHDFDTYTFHITLGYLLRWLCDDEARDVIALSNALHERYGHRLERIALGQPEYCVFENMHHFEPVGRIGGAAAFA